MKLKPLGDRVVVKLIEAEEKTAGGIVIPDKAKERPQEAEVIAVGPGKVLDNGQKLPIDLKVGDRVVLSKYAGTDFKFGEEEYLLLREDDVLAVIEK